MEVPLQDEGLHAGAHEEQPREEEAVPQGGAGVVHKHNQLPVRRQEEEEEEEERIKTGAGPRGLWVSAVLSLPENLI